MKDVKNDQNETVNTAVVDTNGMKKEVLLIIIKTLIVGMMSIIVAFFWEFFKFKRETQFVKKVDLIIENRKTVSEILIDVDQRVRQIQSDEDDLKPDDTNRCRLAYYKDDVERLKYNALKLKHICALDRGVINQDTLTNLVDAFGINLIEYLDCMKSNKDCIPCADSLSSLTPILEKIIVLHTNEVTNLINK